MYDTTSNLLTCKTIYMRLNNDYPKERFLSFNRTGVTMVPFLGLASSNKRHSRAGLVLRMRQMV